MGKRKMRGKQNKRRTAQRTFWVTLCIVLGIGAAVLLAFLFLKPRGSEEKGMEKQILQITNVEGEDIPAPVTDETVREGERVTPEDDRFGADGCIRNENGRIV